MRKAYTQVESVISPGFTLVELLIVLATIAVLISILIPTLKKAKNQARITVCQSNLHQWGIAFRAYTEQNNNRFFKGPLESSWDDWVEIMEPYTASRGEINCCPFATRTHAEGGHGIYAAWSDSEGDYGSYGLNAWICDSGDDELVFKNEAYWNRPDVPEAYTIPVLLDSLNTAGWPDDSSLPPQTDGQPPQQPTLAEQMKNFCINRHQNGMISCLFMDASGREVGLKELWKLKWNRDFNINGHWTEAGGITSDDWPEWMRGFKEY